MIKQEPQQRARWGALHAERHVHPEAHQQPRSDHSNMRIEEHSMLSGISW